MAKRRKVGNLLALTLLNMLMERPMYPYEMATTLRHRGKDQAIKINWGSLYTVVQNLEKHGFIEAVEVAREGKQPERTTYRITDAGLAEMRDWLRELLGSPEREYTKFEAALSDCAVLGPDEVIDLLRQRLATLEEANAKTADDLLTWQEQIPRLFLIEGEYRLAMLRAEAEWVRGLIQEITDGTLPDVDAWRRYIETGTLPAEFGGEGAADTPGS
jgi:DNA-binding PadR family transcriptional regulator